MLPTLEVTFPFFALVLAGWAAARRGWMPIDAIAALNRFVLFFALPCMLFRFAAATPIERMFDPLVFAVWFGVAGVVIALAIGLARRTGADWNNASFGALLAVFPNSGFMGVPLLVGLLGEAAAAPAIVALVVDMVVTTSLCIALSRIGTDTGTGAVRPCAVCAALRGVLVNPLPWAIGLGCVFSALQWQLPDALMKPVDLMADAASPVALFTLGVVLARSQLQALALQGLQASAGRALDRWLDVPAVVVLKLGVHPAAVAAACALAAMAGAPLEPLAVTTLVLMAALPSASNVPMLAERYGADAGRLARIVLLTTALSFFTFLGWVTVVR